MTTDSKRDHTQQESKYNAESYYLLAKQEYEKGNYSESAMYLLKSQQHGSERAKKLFDRNTPHEFNESHFVNSNHDSTDDKKQLGNHYLCMGLRAHAGIAMRRDLKSAFDFYSKAVEEGDTRAILLLANCYRNGYGVEKDQSKAVKLYQTAVDKNVPEALIGLGVCYENGIGVPVNKKEAAECYQKASKEDVPLGYYYLGLCYEHGDGVDKNEKKAAEYYRIAANQGVSKSWINLGVCYENGIGVPENKKKATELYRKTANQGVSKGWINLGVCYENGIGIPVNKKKATELYRKAANQGVSKGWINLGICYEYGHGVPINKKKAAECYQKAGKEDVPLGWYYLGLCYEYGIGVDKDEKKAAEYYRIAANQGVSKSWIALGICHEKGIGLPANKKEAAECYKKACKKDEPLGYYYLGICYQYKVGVDKDENKAAEYYRIAANQGVSKSWVALGLCYEYGRGVPVNLKKATELYRKAGEHGVAKGWDHLGHCYKNGIGVVQDDKQAALYFGAALRRYRDIGDTSGRSTYARAFNSLNSCNSVFATISLALSGHQFIDSETLKGLMTNNLVSTDQECILHQIKIELEQTHGRIGKKENSQTMVESLSTILDDILKTRDHQTDHKLKLLKYSCQLFASIITNKTIALNNEQSSDILCKLLLIIKRFSALLMDESVNHAYNEFAAAAASAYSPIKALHSDAKDSPARAIHIDAKGSPAKVINADVKASPTHRYIPNKVDKEILNLFKLPNSISALESANCTLLSCKFIGLATQLAKDSEKEKLIKVNDSIQAFRVDATHSVCKKAREHFTAIIEPSSLDENEKTDIPTKKDWDKTFVLAKKETHKNRLNRALLNLANEISRRSLSYLDGKYISSKGSIKTEEQQNTNKKVYIPKGLADIYDNIMKLKSHDGDNKEKESYQSILLKIKKIAQAHLDARDNAGCLGFLYYSPKAGRYYQKAATLLETSLEIFSPGHDRQLDKIEKVSSTTKIVKKPNQRRGQ